MKRTMKTLLAACAMTTAMPAAAATQIVNAYGKLTGATGVTVGANTFNVSLVEGTCASVFGTCATSSFDFSSKLDATNAANSLLDQVLIDSKLGMFDSDPSKTFGCTAANCLAIIPYALVSNTAYGYVGSFNQSSTSATGDSLLSDFRGTLENTASNANAVFARFTPVAMAPVVVDPPVIVDVPAPVAAIPELATWAMMMLGMGAIGFAMRQQKTITRVSYAA